MHDMRRQVIYLSDGFPFECLAFAESLTLQEFDLFLLARVVHFSFPDLVFDFKDLLLAAFDLIMLEFCKLGMQAGA